MMWRIRLFFRRLYLRWYYYRSEHWKATASKARRRAHYACERCGAHRPLDVHHITYERLWRERDSDLLAVCRACHNTIHEARHG